MRTPAIAAAAVLSILIGAWHLVIATDGLSVTRLHIGSIPATVFRPAEIKAAPVVVIAHGFAGSQQLMQPFAVTMARNGYVAITFDFPGHGRNPTPLTGGLKDHDASARALLESLAAVTAFARSIDPRLALLGHSMAADIVVRYAQARPDEATATVAVSLFYKDATAESPRNLLIIDGALEPSMLQENARSIVAMVAGAPPQAHVTYGSFREGTARRLALADGVEHIGVLYSGQSLTEALAWFNEAFSFGQAHGGPGMVDARGRWLALLFMGLIVLAWPLAKLLPRVATGSMGGGYRGQRFFAVALLPAIVTPLLLWKMPTNFLPILIGDYLLLHFGMYGLLTALAMRVFRPENTAGVAYNSVSTHGKARLIAAILAATAYSTLAIGLPIDSFIFNFLPGPERVPLIIALLCGTLPYFIADEWLTRGQSRVRGAYAVTKICFLLSLALAVLLNLEKLFFLIIIVPVILLFFIVYGLFSRRAYLTTGHPLVGAVANATVFAWFIAVAFPLVG